MLTEVSCLEQLMVRPRHSTKEIEAAVKYAESKG